MSVNPSRAEKTDGQLRKLGRSGSSGQHNNQRGYLGSGKGGAAGGSTVSSTPPHPSISSSSAFWSSSTQGTQTLSTSRSFKKSGGGPGSQSRVGLPTTNSEAAHQSIQNGTTNAASGANPINMPMPRNAPRAVPKAPSSQTVAGPPSNAAFTATAKGDASKQITLQFGTINPVDVNGLLIPARTSSAPPNLDEQKRDQARHESFRAIPTVAMSTAPKFPQQQAKKDVTAGIQSTTAESQPPLPTKRDVPLAVQPSPVVQPPRPSVIPMSIPFQHPQTQVPMQFGGPNPQMQPQGLGANSLQMTMTLPVAGAHHVAQQFYYSGQMLPQQAMVHPGQGMGFVPPIGHQLSPQMGNLGIGVPSQFPQQQPGKLVGHRKSTVKITHPDTHEELRLDNRTDSFKDGMPSNKRTLSNVPQQPQSIATYAPAHQMNYYSSVQPNSYTHVQHPFPTSAPISLTSSQVPASSQASRYSYAVNQSGQSLNFMNPTTFNPIPGGKSAHQTSSHGVSEANSLQALPVSASSTLASKITVKPAIEKVVAPTLTSSVKISDPNKADTSYLPKPTANVAHHRQGDVAQDNQPQSAELKPVAEMVKNVPLPVLDGFSSSVTSALLLEKAMPETSSPSAPLTPSEDSGSIPAVIIMKEREPFRSSDSLKDNQRKASKKGPTSIQPEQKLDPSHVAENLKISSENSKDSYSEELSTNLENIQAPLASTSSVTSLSGSKVLNDGAVEHNASVALSGSSKTVLDSGSSEDAISNAVDAFTLPSESALFKETGLSGSSVSLESAVDHNIGKKLDANKGREDTCLNSEGKIDVVKATSLGKTEVSEIISRGFADAELNLDSDIVECSKVVDKISPQGKYGDGKLDYEKSCEHDESKVISSTAVEYSNLEEPERCTVATEHKAIDNQVVDLTNSVALETPSMPNSGFSSAAEKSEAKISESSSGVVASALGLVIKEKTSSETSKPKAVAGKKKKKKDICAKADAAGTSDLYTAYKGPEEYRQVSSRSEIVDSSSSTDINIDHVDDSKMEAVVSEEDVQNKTELEDWEDAADISTPKLKAEHLQPLNGAVKRHEEGNEATSRKKYSKDFLLTFQQQITELPLGFYISSDIAESLMSISLGKSNFVDREPYPSPGRIIDRPSGTSRIDRRMGDDDRWTRSGPFAAGRDLRSEVAHGAAVVNLRPGQGSNHGPSRNMRSPSFSGGILSGPIQPLVPPGGMPRNNSDADRWQRATGPQRGLMPSPQTPLQVMHKAERKYEVGKVAGEEEAKQRQLKGILNKLTPQNFEKLFAQVKEVNIDNAVTLTGVISQIFDKALMEPTFCEMYASFCVQLAGALPEIIEDNEKITFRRLLLNKCQEEFERGEREQAEASKAEVEGETTKSEREEMRIRARRRMLGNIRLIGELYKKKMLTDKIMHECIIKLLGQYENPDEEDVECLCKLMATIGEIIDHPKAKVMDAYFNMIGKLSTNMKLSSRVRFMLKDVIDLRRNRWQQRRKVEGPKKIEEVHRDAAQERQAQSSRLARGPSISSGSRRGPVGDFNTRGPTPLSSQHVGGIRAMPSQVRGYGQQDVRLDERPQFESKTLSIPHRSTDDNSITLGPQGGLGRVMSIRGQPLMPNPSTAENISSIVNHRRVVPGQNGNNPPPDWTSHTSREDTPNRYTADRYSGAIYDQPGSQDHKIYGSSRESRTLDHTFDRPTSLEHAGRPYVSSANSQSLPSETNLYSEDVLREKSKLAIREFYSAKDEGEVALCIKELNSPNFYPSMLSLWVTDSFERKDMERELLAKLIVNLCGGSVVSAMQLIEGFRDVLMSLEDAVNDAPKAAEFLGRIFAKVIMENIIALRDVGRLIHEGGEEPGRLREIGLAAEVLGSIFESIRVEKGESVLNEIRSGSNLNLEEFLPLHPLRSRKLDAFL